MKPSAALCLAILVLAGPASGAGLLIDDPAGCSQVLGSPDGVLDYAASGGLILDGDGYSSLEYFCSFQPGVDFGWQAYSVSDRSGRCELPGPQYFPQLFTIVTDPEEPGVVQIWTGEAEPLRFFSCAS